MHNRGWDGQFASILCALRPPGDDAGGNPICGIEDVGLEADSPKRNVDSTFSAVARRQRCVRVPRIDLLIQQTRDPNGGYLGPQLCQDLKRTDPTWREPCVLPRWYRGGQPAMVMLPRLLLLVSDTGERVATGEGRTCQLKDEAIFVP